MMTIAQAMETLVSNLEIKRCDSEPEESCSCTRCEIRRQRGVVEGHLNKALTLSELKLSGSYKRHTAIRPLNDIDLFVVLDPIKERKLYDAGPKATLKRVEEVLDDAYPTKEKPKAQSRSVNIEFKGTRLAYDVVPAFPHASGGYIIPDRDAGDWIRTKPDEHVQHATKANEKAGKKAKPIVKALKLWNRSQAGPGGRKLVSSFHLEQMVYGVLTSPPTSYAAGIAEVLRALETQVQLPTPEPAGVGPNVDDRMSWEDRERARKAFAEAADTAEAALKAASDGHLGHAHHHWRTLFGPAYPEKGTAPKAAAPTIITGSAPDPSGRRFG